MFWNVPAAVPVAESVTVQVLFGALAARVAAVTASVLTLPQAGQDGPRERAAVAPDGSVGPADHWELTAEGR